MRRTLLAALLATAAVAASSCGVVWQAPQVTLIVQPDGIKYATVDDPGRLVGGETLLTVKNDDGVERQITLARLDAADATIPQEIIDAEFARDDERILRVSPVLEPKKAETFGGVVVFVLADHLFHVHLEPGQTYVLFDRLSGVNQGLVTWFTPGEGGAS